MRKATRKYRAAAGRFGPKRRFKRQYAGRRYTKRGPSKGKGGGRSRRGFFIGEHFVSLEHIPNEEVEAFFGGKGGRKGKGKGKRGKGQG